MDRALLTAEEVSAQLFGGKKSTESIWRDVRNNHIPYVRIGRRVFFDADVIRDWIGAQSMANVKENTRGL